MEFVEAMGIMNMMCLKSKHCSDCPIFEKLEDSAFNCMGFFQHCPEEAEEILTKWNAEHPVKTRKQVLFERLPGALTDKSGTPVACALQLGLVKTLACCGESCNGECKKCWNLPYYEESK